MNTIKVTASVTLNNAESEKEVKEKYTYALTECISFSEAENIVLKDIASLGGIVSYKIESLSKVEFSEILENEDKDKFYAVTICVEHLLDSGKIKKQAIKYLVAADSVKDANEIIVKHLHDAMWDYHIVTVTETKYTTILSAISAE